MMYSHNDKNDFVSTSHRSLPSPTSSSNFTPHNHHSHRRNNSFSKTSSLTSIASVPTATTSSSTTAMNDESRSSSSSVQVAVRVRPSLPSENGTHKCITVNHNHRHYTDDNNVRMPPNTSNMIEIGAGVKKMGGNSKTFYFDACFSPKASQREVFNHAIKPLVDACVDGYNATVLAYGQTGSGKTHTILGPQESSFDHHDDYMTSYESTSPNNGNDITSTASSSASSQAGIIPRALRDLFGKLESIKNKSIEIFKNGKQQQSNINDVPYEYEVRVQFLELYGEEIRDLLSSSPQSNKLVIRDGVNPNHEPDVVGAIEIKVNSAADAMLCLTRGMLRRVTAATAMNAESSRSHAIMTVVVEQTMIMVGDNGTNGGSSNSNNISGGGSRSQDFESKRSKFHFVDLAGSERQKRSQAVGIRLKEGIDINKGLLVLGNVISALGDPKKRGKAFVPYRDSKLTRLLKGSLGGNHKTLMIACVSPSSINMEESLNCLRYANRAKNIQNNAVINVDAGSKLVIELRGQVKALASELLNVQKNDIDGRKKKRFTNEMLQKMANGDDSTKMQFGSTIDFPTHEQSPHRQKSQSSTDNITSESNLTPTNSNVNMTGKKGRQLYAEKVFLDVSNAEISLLKQTIQALKSELASKEEELFVAKAEVEFYRMQLKTNHDDDQALYSADTENKEGTNTGSEQKMNFVTRLTEYEREIAKLKMELREVKAARSTLEVEDDNETFTTAESAIAEERESPEKVHQHYSTKQFKTQKKDRRAVAAMENECKEEQKEIDLIAQKYLKLAENSVNEDEHDNDNANQSLSDFEVDTEDMFQNRQAHLDAHMVELSKGINAKEELITKLKLSQTKYETMKNFYQDKLRKMTLQLRDQVAEMSALESELKKYEEDTQKYKDLKAALRAKEKHIDHLRNRQVEIESLTTIASRNESVIENLKNEIIQMKQQKVSLQKQLLSERKDHERSMQQLRKKAFTFEKDASKAKQDLARTLVQKQKVQAIAKSHADEISQLRSKYREAEKKLRMKTLKRGVMERAGIDPVLVGRKENMNRQARSRSRFRSANSPSSYQESRNYTADDINRIRLLLDEKVAEISRKEASADKLALEWEDHLELTTRKDQLAATAKSSKDNTLSDEVEALDFQIQYKESRIRQLARRLSSRPKANSDGKDNTDFLQDTMIDDHKLQQITSGISDAAAAKLTSKILFGMVVKERRRVAKLARTASSLDQKVLFAEKMAQSKEAALRSHMEEAKNDSVAMAQSHQEKILSLMSLLHQDQEEQNRANGATSPEKHESVLLSLANERIDMLEMQIEEMQLEKRRTEEDRSKNDEMIEELKTLTEEYGNLLGQSKQMRSSLARIKDRVILQSSDLGWPESKDRKEILRIIDRTLNKGTASKVTNESKKSPQPPPTRRRVKPLLYETESEDDDGSQIPEWADNIMQDLAIIAQGEVPPSLKKTKNNRPPSGSSVFDRLWNPESYTGSQRNVHGLNSDDMSVKSTYSTHSTVRRDRASLVKLNPSQHSKNNRSSTPTRPRSQSNTPVRKKISDVPTPFRYTNLATSRSVKSSSSRSQLTSRISEILKDSGRVGPPTELSLPTEASQNIQQTFLENDKQGFFNAYTKKDVFERLQKNMTNSFTLSQKASMEDEEG